jgi:hypothetical protein
MISKFSNIKWKTVGSPFILLIRVCSYIYWIKQTNACCQNSADRKKKRQSVLVVRLLVTTNNSHKNKIFSRRWSDLVGSGRGE